MIRIILIGYMGAGKTTIGKALAKALGVTFYDLDWYIETRMRRTVKQIFDSEGEEGFRRIEHNMLHEVAEFENVVLSCGGAHTVLLRQHRIYEPTGTGGLSQGFARGALRASQDGQVGAPAIAQQTPEQVREFIEEQLAYREQFYSKAHYTLDINLLDNYDKINVTVEKLIELLK